LNAGARDLTKLFGVGAGFYETYKIAGVSARIKTKDVPLRECLIEALWWLPISCLHLVIFFWPFT
jgi:hypothetical protein